MKAIVMYASGYGFTRGIAEFIAEKLRQQGTQAEVRQINKVIILVTIDVFVIGSAVYGALAEGGDEVYNAKS